MRAFNVRFTVERNGFTRNTWGKTLCFDARMKRAKNTTKKKGREEDELIFKGTVEPFYSSAHPVTPAVLHRCYSFRFVINCAFRYHLCDEYDSLSLTLSLSNALSLSLVKNRKRTASPASFYPPSSSSSTCFFSSPRIQECKRNDS